MTDKHISLEEGRKLAVRIFDRPRPLPEELSDEERKELKKRLAELQKKTLELEERKKKIAKLQKKVSELEEQRKKLAELRKEVSELKKQLQRKKLAELQLRKEMSELLKTIN